MRPRYQNGQLEIRSDGKGKYYSGRYTIYVTDENGKEVRKQPRPFLGYCSETSKAQALDRLQQLINESQNNGGPTSEETGPLAIVAMMWINEFADGLRKELAALEQQNGPVDQRKITVAYDELRQLKDALMKRIMAFEDDYSRLQKRRVEVLRQTQLPTDNDS